MKTLKLFDYYSEFPFDEEKLKKQIDSAWRAHNLCHIANLDTKKVISKEIITEDYKRLKNDGFYFKISEAYKTFFFELGIMDVNSFLFPNPLFDLTFLEFELYFVTENIGEDYFVINNVTLPELTDRFDYNSLKEYIKTMEVSIEYVLRCAIYMNNYAFSEYKEGYIPNFNALAELKLDELKEE